MNISTDNAKALLAAMPRKELAFLPTPLYRLDKLSDELGINLYIKRDDFTGSNLYGGNKTRKLEFLMGRALETGCEYVFTYGATQSNHAMQTAWAAAKSGLKPVLYLAAVVTPDMNDLKANLLLDKILGAEVHVVDLLEGEDFAAAEHRSFDMGAEHIKRLEADGHKCMDIPMGGANEYGSLGYINAMVELTEQMQAGSLHFDYLYHSTGSGGTLAGIAAGRKLLGLDFEIHSITAMEVGESYAKATAALANKSLGLLGPGQIAFAPEDFAVEEADFVIDQNHYAPGYEMPSEGGTEAIRMLAREEGIFVDPVYSGKALAGLIADARSGRIPKDSNVLFLHTGGSTAFFAEKEIIGTGLF